MWPNRYTVKWTETKSPFIISLPISLAFTGEPEECFWSQGINFSSEGVPSSLWKVFDFPPSKKKKKKFTLANGYRFPWGRLGELLYCVIVAAFQAPCRSGPSSVFHGDLDYELAYTWELKYGSMTVLMSKRPYWLQI